MPLDGGGGENGRGPDTEDASNTSIEIPAAPSITRHSTRTITKPIHYSQEQEKESAEKTVKKTSRHGKQKEMDLGNLQVVLQGLWDSNNILQHQVIKLTNELEKRDEEFRKRELEHQKMITTIQLHLKELQQDLRAAKQEAQESKETLIHLHEKSTEETRQEVATLREEVTELSAAIRAGNRTNPETTTERTASTGRSWASVTTPTSAVSSTTRTSRINRSLPMVRIDTNRASTQTKEILQNPSQLQHAISTHLHAYEPTKNVRIEGIKSAPRNIVKVFVDIEESATVLREHQEWLRALPGTQLRGEPWYPVKLDEVKKTDVYDDNGRERPDFREQFAEENNGTQIRMTRWLSGPKAYGSMAIFVSKEEDAHRLLDRKIVPIQGEAAFAEAFQYQSRPTRCRNCQQYGHKAARCPNPTVCARCAEHHATTDCKTTNTRCAACQKNGHTADDRNCDTWKKMKEEAQGRQSPLRTH
ncbi:hypothetical protein IFM51744_10500 [Aspergillus udagawae]|nr:hypothetical protein IFM51744_10500 [Aspergillus udagawae]